MNVVDVSLRGEPSTVVSDTTWVSLITATTIVGFKDLNLAIVRVDVFDVGNVTEFTFCKADEASNFWGCVYNETFTGC